MDILTHSLVGAHLAFLFLPRRAVQSPYLLIFAGALGASLPDLDYVLWFLGPEALRMHHGGLTHSVFGALLMLPMIYCIAFLLVGDRQRPLALDRSLVGFALGQFFIGHVLLDVLSLRGTMLFFPLSTERVSLAISRGPDPLLILIECIALVLLLRAKSLDALRLGRLACLCAVPVIGLWLTQAGTKEFLEREVARHLALPAGSAVHAIPAAVSPLFWSYLGISGKGDRIKLYQGGFSPVRSDVSGSKAGSDWFFDVHVPEHFLADRLCSSALPEASRSQVFAGYRAWGGRIACTDLPRDGHAGCLCISLKFQFAGLTSTEGESSFWIAADGSEGSFLPRASRRAMFERFAELYL